MNQKQRIVIWIGMLAVVVAVLYLPWNDTYSRSSAPMTIKNAGYHFVTAAPTPAHDNTQGGVVVDWGRVLLELVAIAVVTGGLFVTLTGSGRQEARARHAWGSPDASTSDAFEAFTGVKDPEREMENMLRAERGLPLLEADKGVLQPDIELDGWTRERKDARRAELLALIGEAPAASPPSSASTLPAPAPPQLDMLAPPSGSPHPSPRNSATEAEMDARAPAPTGGASAAPGGNRGLVSTDSERVGGEPASDPDGPVAEGERAGSGPPAEVGIASRLAQAVSGPLTSAPNSRLRAATSSAEKCLRSVRAARSTSSGTVIVLGRKPASTAAALAVLSPALTCSYNSGASRWRRSSV